MKKITAYILALVLVFSFIPSYAIAAADTPKGEHMGALLALSIVPEGFGEDKITIADAARAFLSMTSEEFADASFEECMEAATQREMVKEQTPEYAQKECGYDEAIRMAVCIAGYKNIAVLSGGYPKGFNAQASAMKILKNVTRSAGGGIDSNSFTELLYNTMTAKYNKLVGFSGFNNISEADKSITVLSHYRDIHAVSGVVDANYITTINGESSLNIDEISIAGSVYKDINDYQEYVGREVEAFCRITDDAEELLYLALGRKSQELTVYSPEIISVDDSFEILRYEDGDGRVKQAKLSPSIRFFYNGAVKWDYTKDTFSPKNGKIVLADNDGDRKYDVVYVTDAKLMLMDGYDEITRVIFNKYRYTGAEAFVSVDTDAGAVVKVYRNGEAADINALEKDDVLRVSESENPDRTLVEIYASSRRITAKPTSQDADRVIIEDSEYFISAEYKSALAADEALAAKITLSREYEFYIDDLGNIAAVSSATSGVLYGYALKYSKNEDDEYIIRILDSRGAWQRLTLNERVHVNATRYTDAQAISELCQGGSFIPQLIGYAVNKEGRIKQIYKAVNYAGKKTNDFFTKKGWSTATYWSSLLSFGTDTYLNSPTVWVVPETDTYDEDDYYVMSDTYFKGNKSYEYMAYDLDEFTFSDKIVVKRKATDETWEHNLFGRLMLVEKTGTAVNSDDEVCLSVSGQADDYENYRFLSKNSSLSGVKKGDIIKVYFDKDGYVSTCETIYSEALGKQYSDSETLDSRQVILKGFAAKVDAARKLIKVKLPAEKVYKFVSNPYVHILNQSTGEITTGNLTNISENDYVVMRNSYGTISHIFIIK